MMFTHGVTWLACVDDDGFYKGYVTQTRHHAACSARPTGT